MPYFTSFSWYKLFIKLYKSTWYRNGPKNSIINGFLEHQIHKNKNGIIQLDLNWANPDSASREFLSCHMIHHMTSVWNPTKNF